jgi:hypothetical protein
MYKRVVLTAAAMLACAAAGPPARATVTNPNVNDVYAIAGNGKIYRIPNGSYTANLEATVPNMSAIWLDFDPGSGEWIAGPDTSAVRNYQRLPQNLSSTGSEIPNTDSIGGNGGAVDRFGGSPNQASDLLVADSNPFMPPDKIGVYRIKPDGTATIAAAVGLTGYLEPVNVEQDWATGDIYVACRHTASLPGSVLRFNKNGGLLDHFDLPSGIDPDCIVFDNRDAMPNYELIVGSPSGAHPIYAVDIDLPLGSNRVIFLRNAPDNQECADLSISPSGKLIYPGSGNGNVYQINLTSPYASSLLANVPGVKSVAFVSRNKLSSQDHGLTVGQFSTTTGPAGKPGVQVKVSDPEFSSGIVDITVTGANLVVYDRDGPHSLPYTFASNTPAHSLDARREITQFTFVAEKINAAAGANIQVSAHDAAGLLGDPPAELVVSNKGNPAPLSVDLASVPPVRTDARVVTISNSGIDKITLDIGGESYKLNGDKKMDSGQTVNVIGKNGVIKIALDGTTTLLVKMGDTLTVTIAGNGQSVGNDAMIAIN